MKGCQLHHQACLSFLRFLSKMGFLLQLLSDSRQLLIEGMDGLLVLILFLIFDLLMLPKLTDHSLLGDTPIPKRLHTHQCLKSKQPSTRE